MTHSDYALTSLCLWREARNQGNAGLTAVACVLRNRVMKHNSTYMSEVVKPWAFSSMTATNDSQLTLYPKDSDPIWQQCQLLAANVMDGEVDDITGGATLYYNPAGIVSTATFMLNDGSVVKFPQGWNPAVVKETVVIGAHIFLKEP